MKQLENTEMYWNAQGREPFGKHNHKFSGSKDASKSQQNQHMISITLLKYTNTQSLQQLMVSTHPETVTTSTYNVHKLGDHHFRL